MKYIFTLLFAVAVIGANAQCNYVRANSTTAADTVTFTFTGGAFQSFGCAPIDPTYWMSGGGMSVNVAFQAVQSEPKFRVWGMNDNDTATVMVNGVAYPLTSQSASYDTMVVCGVVDGNGVTFANGKLAGTSGGNYSYQDITLNTQGVTSITVTSQAGLGWGFAGVLVCKGASVGIDEELVTPSIRIYPNPATTAATIQFGTTLKHATVALYNQMGQTVNMATGIAGNSFTINRNNLPAGVYFIRVTEDNKQLAVKKLIIAD